MKIEVFDREKEEKTVTLELALDAEVEGEALIRDKEEGWSIVSFREVNGRLSLVRHTSIDDEDGRFNVDADGRIELVDE